MFKDFFGGFRKPLFYETPAAEIPKVYVELLNETNLLVAGSTGSGKSVVLDGIVHAFACMNPPNARLWLVDPKRVDLVRWCALPHVERYANRQADILRLLKDLTRVMEWRYNDMHNRKIAKWDGSQIYLIIDELGDLMTTDKRLFLPILTHLAQLVRASGIHIIACTQSPSRQVIPSVIQLNFTGLALHCRSGLESRQVIGQNGAELLPRFGQGLYNTADGLGIVDLPLTTEDEKTAVIEWWRTKGLKYKQ